MGNKEDESFSDSSTDSDLAPVILQQFHCLSESLKETDQNLNTFEHLFDSYKKQSRLHTTEQGPDEARAQNDILAELCNLRSELLERRNDETHFEEMCALQATIQRLQEQLRQEEDKNVNLRESNKKLNDAFAWERQKCHNLEQKLNAERQTALAKEAYTKKLEDQIACLLSAKEKSVLDISAKTDDSCKLNESLCKTCICHSENPLESVVDRVDQLARDIESKNRKLVGELVEAKRLKKSNSADQSRSSANASLKLSLAELVAERDSLLAINVSLDESAKRLEAEAREREAKFHALKQKCKSLLAKFRSQTEDRRKFADKLSIAKRVLFELQRLCKMKDENHGILMNYFGGQIEIGGRLLAAFMGGDYQGPVLATEKHKKLTEWFCSVHSVSVWTQRQILALGEQLISDDQASLSIALNRDTLSDISTSLVRDHGLPVDVMRALQNEAAVLERTKENVDELRQVLELENS